MSIDPLPLILVSELMTGGLSLVAHSEYRFFWQAESHLAVQFGKSLVLSPQQLVDCAPNPDHCGGTGGCLGSTAELAYNYSKVAGLVSEEEYPYVRSLSASLHVCVFVCL